MSSRSDGFFPQAETMAPYEKGYQQGREDAINERNEEQQDINQSLIDFANKLKDKIFQDDDIPSKYGRIVWKHIDELLKEMEQVI